jgi:hypothetical protein
MATKWIKRALTAVMLGSIVCKASSKLLIRKSERAELPEIFSMMNKAYILGWAMCYKSKNQQTVSLGFVMIKPKLRIIYPLNSL